MFSGLVFRAHCVKMCFRSANGDVPCAEPMKCVNYDGQRSSSSHNYPVCKQEVAIQKLRTLKKGSYLDAEKLVCPVNQGKISYPRAVKSTVSPAPIVKEMLSE